MPSGKKSPEKLLSPGNTLEKCVESLSNGLHRLKLRHIAEVIGPANFEYRDGVVLIAADQLRATIEFGEI